MNERVGLVLEGGGMRGIFSTGVLDYFIEANIEFPIITAVSAGACHGGSFISKQKYRGRDIVLDYIQDDRYCSLKNWIKTGNLFDTQFAYYDIAEIHKPYDFESFKASKSKFYNVMSNVETGRAEYALLKDMKTDIEYTRASSSLPFLSKIVKLDGKKYLDGGISDPLPIRFNENNGFERNIIILTREKGYRKKEKKNTSYFIKMYYHKYPKFIEQWGNRSKVYNETLDYIEQQEKEGKVLVLRPKDTSSIKRIEKDLNKLEGLYQVGYECAKEHSEEIIAFLSAK